MPRPVIDVLLVEDDEADAHRIEVMLKRSEDVVFRVKHAVTLKAALTVIGMKPPCVVLLDLSLDDFQGYDTVVEYTKSADVPFVVLTGNDDMQMAMRCVSLGAQDYVLKNDVQAKPLERTILLALRRASNERASMELDQASRAVVFESGDQATVSMLRPKISRMIEVIEDVENYLRKNAPGLMADVRSILDKYDTDVTIKGLRDVLRLHASRSSFPPPRERKISDHALKAVDSVVKKRKPPSVESPADADQNLLDIIRRREPGSGQMV